MHRRALAKAVHMDNTKIVKLLIDANADINAICYNNGTVLQNAAMRGNKEIVQLLIDAILYINDVS